MDKARNTEVYPSPNKGVVGMPPPPRKVTGRHPDFNDPSQSLAPSNATTSVTDSNAKNPQAEGHD